MDELDDIIEAAKQSLFDEEERRVNAEAKKKKQEQIAKARRISKHIWNFANEFRTLIPSLKNIELKASKSTERKLLKEKDNLEQELSGLLAIRAEFERVHKGLDPIHLMIKINQKERELDIINYLILATSAPDNPEVLQDISVNLSDIIDAFIERQEELLNGIDTEVIASKIQQGFFQTIINLLLKESLIACF